MTTSEGPGKDEIGQPWDMSGIPTPLLEARDVWDQTALSLGPDEIAELIITDGRCIQVAHMHEFSSPEEFFEGQNNFWLAFTATGLGELYRKRKHYQRFAILYPELYIHLLRGDAEIRKLNKSGEDAQQSDGWWNLIYDAYQKVSRLVDVRDDDAQVDGRISPGLLIGYPES